MSDYPPPPLAPLPYYSPQYSSPRRPLSVSIIGWCAAIYGGIGAFGGLCFAIQRLFLAGWLPTTDPLSAVIYAPGAIKDYLMISMAIGWIVSILLLAGGVGCLNLKPWAPRMILGVMIYNLFAVLAGAVFSICVMMPAFAKIAAQHPGDLSIQMAYRIQIFSQMLGFVFGIAIPLVVIYFVTRPRFKSAFAAPQPLPPPMA